MRKDDSLFYFLNIVIPILIGSTIYLLYSPSTIFVKVISEYLTIKSFKLNIITEFLRNYFCDFCWCYSLSFAIAFIYRESPSAIMSILLPISIGICLEILQMLGIISGTYDVIDILFELSACVMCYFIVIKRNGKEEEK